MGCGRMMVGGVLLCAVASAFLLAQSAPTKSSSKSSSNELTSHEKPLVRTKRAEDIMYGNPQSSARVKKSDPSAVAASDDDEATKTDANALPPEENDRKDDAEQSLPDEKQSDEQEEYGGASNEQNNLEEMPIEAVEGVSDGDGDSEPQETARRKRSAAAEALMTAEGMASSAARRTPLRAKRDLDYEELRQLLENSRQAKEEQEEQEEEEQEGDDEVGLPVDLASVLQETNSEGEEEEEEDDREDGAVSLVMSYPYAPRVSSEKEELIRELVAEREKEEAKEKVIDYLLAAALTDAESTADDGGRFLVEAPVALDDIGPVAAAAKRSALYPYHGNRWAEPVSGPKRSRLGEYERLNRLAEALGVYNDYEEETEEEEK